MSSIQEQARDFLDQPRIAVAGVSRNPKEAANLIFRKLRDTGHEVFAVNPKAETVEGVPCYPRVSAIPGPVDACVIATPPGAAEQVVEECVAHHVRHVWMHRSFGTGSVSEAAVLTARRHGLEVIAGGCPMMFCEPVDLGHKCMRWILKARGRLDN